MKLKSTFKLILFSLFLNSPGVLAADNSAVLGQWVLDMFVQGEKVPINLTIAEDGDELGGTWVGPQVSNALSEGSVGGTLLGQQIANALANGSFKGTLVGQQIANALSDGSLGTILPGQQVTDSLSDVIFDGDTLSFFRQTPQGLLDMSLKLEGNTLSGSLSTPQGATTIFGRKAYTPTEEWPSPYNGVTPDPSFGLAFNNIGVFSASDSIIYTCLRMYTEDLIGVVGGISELDVNLTVVSFDEATFQITSYREFNTIGALNETTEYPDCSGKFETTTSVYTDLIEVGDSILETTWSLIDSTNLILKLISYRELAPN